MRRDWLESAGCVGMDPRDFELEDSQIKDRDKEVTAWTLCTGCAVASECARDALAHDDQGTVRGGVWMPSRYHPRRRIQLDKLRLVAQGFI